MRGWASIMTTMTELRPASAPTVTRICTIAIGVSHPVAGGAAGRGLDRDDERCRLIQHGLVRHEADHDARHEHVEDGAHGKRAEDATGHVPLRVLRLLRGRSRPRRIRCRQRRSHPPRASTPLQPYSPKVPVFSGMNGCQFAGTMKNAPAPITISTTATLMTTMTELTVADSLTPKMSSAVTATVTSTAGRLNTAVTGSPPATATTRPRCGAQRGWETQAQLAEQRDEIARPADGHRRGTERVLEDQIPADDPGDELAERGVAIGVGRAGDRNARRELRIAERRQHARRAPPAPSTGRWPVPRWRRRPARSGRRCRCR